MNLSTSADKDTTRNPRPAADRLAHHLQQLKLHLEAIGHPAEASAVLTGIQLVDELRHERRLRVAA